MKIRSSLIIYCLIMAVSVVSVHADLANDSFNKGIDLLNNHNYSGALDAFNQSIQLNPQDARAWNGKGCTLNLLNRTNEAMDAFNQSIQLDPRFTKAWNSKGYLLLKLGQTKEAMEAFNRTRELDPNNTNAKKGLTNLQNKQKSS